MRDKEEEKINFMMCRQMQCLYKGGVGPNLCVCLWLHNRVIEKRRRRRKRKRKRKRKNNNKLMQQHLFLFAAAAY